MAEDNRRELDRRAFIRASARAGLGVTVLSWPFMNGCKGGHSTGPEPPPPKEEPVPVDLEFLIYNHTKGFQGSFSKSRVLSGTTLTLNVADLLNENAISGVDTRRVALRENNFGTLIAYSATGSVALTVPRQDSTFNIFLFNSDQNSLYDWFDQQPAMGWTGSFRHSLINVSRLDFDGQTGEERVWGGEPNPEIGGNPGIFDQINQALYQDWGGFRYGYFRKVQTGGGIITYGFGNGKGNLIGDLYWSGEFNTTINAERLGTIPEQVGIGLAAIFQRTMGWYQGYNSDDIRLKIQTNGVLNAAGKDCLAYMYVRSAKAANVPI